MAKPDKITGAEIIAALGDGTVDPRDIVRLITAACEAVEQVESEHAARDKAEKEQSELAAKRNALVAAQRRMKEESVRDMERRQKEERELTDGTTGRTIASRLKSIGQLPQFQTGDQQPDAGDDNTVMED